MDEALTHILGKTIKNVEQEELYGREITITFTDGSMITIGSVGDDATYTLASTTEIL